MLKVSPEATLIKHPVKVIHMLIYAEHGERICEIRIDNPTSIEEVIAKLRESFVEVETPF